jgi:hypothetical protein
MLQHGFVSLLSEGTSGIVGNRLLERKLDYSQALTIATFFCSHLAFCLRLSRGGGQKMTPRQLRGKAAAWSGQDPLAGLVLAAPTSHSNLG